MLFATQKSDPLKQLGKLLHRGTHPVMGVYNPYSALLAERAGFKMVYLSGAALSGSLALPDLGVISLDELVFMVRAITRIVQVPLIVDADTGFGEVLNVMRTVRELETAGAAAIQLEDQEMPKKCGHLEGKKVVEPLVMVQRVKAAVEARENNDFLIIARTDAKSTHGLKEAIERANLYLEAGADIIFPEALESRNEFEEFAKQVKAPLLANMTEFGKSPLLLVHELAKLNYRFVVFPVSLFRVANRAMKEAAEGIMRKGTQQSLLRKMQTREEFYRTISYRKYERLDSNLARTSLVQVKTFRASHRRRRNSTKSS